MLNVSATVGTRSASASFDTIGTNLVVTLSNISALDAMVPIDVLTGVFFDVAGAPLSLTRVSAIVPMGSVVHFGPTDPGNVVGGEWAYKGGIAGPRGADYGISSSGLGLFGPGDRFPGNDLQPPASPNGLEYGITTMGDNVATGNTPMTGANALIQHQVVFTLSGLPLGFDPMASISNVSFQYGTALDEPNIPAPAGVVSMLALAGLAQARRRRA